MTTAPHPASAAMARGPVVAMLSAAHPPEDVRVVGKEGAALAAAGWQVLHICPGESAPAESAGVALSPYARRRGWRGRMLGLPALVRRARRSGAAVLHASEPDAWLAALLAARGSGARVVLDVHEHYPSRLDHRLPRPLRPVARAAIRLACRGMAARADAVVVAKDGLDQDFGPAARLLPVRNYAEALPLLPRIHAPGPVTLVHLGALTRSRGSHEMLDALALCPEGTRLSLVGRFTDGSEAAFLERMEALALGERVERHGWRARADALALAAEADIGLVLFQPGIENHRLALPHKLFDCMLAGLPVIAPAFATEVAEVVREARCGLLVDATSPSDIAAAVAELSDPAHRALLGANGRAAALGRFGWASEAERLVGLYQELAPLPGPVPGRAGGH
ncbi:glycosyltransferase [Roseomonas sp. OT10]|uniref:glycosyltransferase n=1 Tax=Roseomonas cutis TaxID=2897332 RepID=UPI001E51648F|nr:glycosyltransferase [Roseomonas sp. OT10]UFN51383.1 glycosyltransferase [Roseomonas sp. OT10]